MSPAGGFAGRVRIYSSIGSCCSQLLGRSIHPSLPCAAAAALCPQLQRAPRSSQRVWWFQQHQPLKTSHCGYNRSDETCTLEDCLLRAATANEGKEKVELPQKHLGVPHIVGNDFQVMLKAWQKAVGVLVVWNIFISHWNNKCIKNLWHLAGSPKSSGALFHIHCNLHEGSHLCSCTHTRHDRFL